MRELKKRSLTKTVSWRIIATSITIIVAFLFLGEIATSTTLGITMNLIKGTTTFSTNKCGIE